MRNLAFVAIWFVGVAVIAAGVFLEWMEVSLVLVDGSTQTVSASGMELFTEYGGTGASADYVPVLYIAFAVVMALVGAWLARGGSGRPSSTTGAAALVLLVMIVLGAACVDSQFYTGVSGVATGAVPEWMSDLASGEVVSGSVSPGLGYVVSCIGALMCVAVSAVGASRSARSPTEGGSARSRDPSALPPPCSGPRRHRV